MIFKAIEYKTIIPFIVSLALFMEALDTTIINTAIPAMSRSFLVNPVDLKIALISYLLSLAIFIPISGWVADKYGIKRVFMIALFVFTLSSLWCGFAGNLWELMLARFLQGLGGSHMLPLGRLIIVRTFARHELINTMTRVIMVSAIGMMLGPVLGGIITTHFSWRWIFWINIPVGLMAILMAHHWLNESERLTVQPLDLLAFVFFGAGISGITFSISAFSESYIKLSASILVFCISILMLLGYFLRSQHERHPIVNTKLFRYRTFSVSITGNLCSRLSFGAVPFLLPLLLQIVFGYSAQTSGMLLAPTALGVIFAKPLSYPVLKLFGYKRLLILNTLFVSAALLVFSTLNTNTPFFVITCYTFIFGLLIATQYSAMNSIAYAELPPEYLSAATSITGTAQQLSQSFGIAVGAFLLELYSLNMSNGMQLSSSVFQHTFQTMCVITVFTTLIFMRLHSEDGDEMIHER